jgi:hypothetical protein
MAAAGPPQAVRRWSKAGLQTQPRCHPAVVPFPDGLLCCAVLCRSGEVTTAYGPLGNRHLMMLYGFALPHNPHDAIEVSKPRVTPSASGDLGPASSWMGRAIVCWLACSVC